jgi:general secretion pathway protein G
MKKNKFVLKMYVRGFTLIELIVSIAILAVLSTFLLAAVNPFEQFQKAQDTRRKSDLSQMQKALESYYQDKGRYPATSGAPNYYFQTSDVIDPVKEWGTSWAPYMTIIPIDNGGRKYIYNASADGQSYWIYASLSRGVKDIQACNNGNACSNVPPGVLCGASVSNICNYGVSSPNVSP